METYSILEKVLREKYNVTEFISKENNWYYFDINGYVFQAGIKERRNQEDIINAFKNIKKKQKQNDLTIDIKNKTSIRTKHFAIEFYAIKTIYYNFIYRVKSCRIEFQKSL